MKRFLIFFFLSLFMSGCYHIGPTKKEREQLTNEKNTIAQEFHAANCDDTIYTLQRMQFTNVQQFKNVGLCLDLINKRNDIRSNLMEDIGLKEIASSIGTPDMKIIANRVITKKISVSEANKEIHNIVKESVAEAQAKIEHSNQLYEQGMRNAAMYQKMMMQSHEETMRNLEQATTWPKTLQCITDGGWTQCSQQ